MFDPYYTVFAPHIYGFYSTHSLGKYRSWMLCALCFELNPL